MAVPGAPVLVSTQKSLVMPHWPQTLQQAFNGQGLSLEISEPSVGALEPGFCGPHTALEISAGNGGVPLLRHMMVSRNRSWQPFQPQVCLLKSSRSCLVRLNWAAISSQLSSVMTWYVWHVPFVCTSGVVNLAWPVTLVDAENNKQVALDQVLIAS